MDWYRAYKLEKVGDEYYLKIYLNKDSEEFASEFFSDIKKNVLKYDKKIKSLINEKFSDIKINAVKLIVGSLVVATIPMAAASAVSVQAAEPAIQTQAALSDFSNTYGTVTATKLNVRSGPGTGYSIIHLLWQGNRVRVIDEQSGWYKIRLSDGKIGWVSKAYLTDVAPNSTKKLDTTGVVTASKLNVRSGPSTSSTVIHMLWNGNRVKVIGQSDNWYQIRLSDGRTGWVSAAYLQLDTATPQTPSANTIQEKRNLVISTAKSFLGTPYVWGGTSPADGGFDCSGFTQYAFKAAGYQLNRISADQAKQGIPVSYNDLQPADLIFNDLSGDGVIDHVGIYIGDGKMIHSPKTGDVVKIVDITTAYWRNQFRVARRILI